MAKLKKPIIFRTAFGVYNADQLIGEGGAGKVYLGVDEKGEQWAIKALDPNKASKEKLRRFKNEYTFCSRNQHKNILTVTEHGLYQDEKSRSIPFYVMPKYGSSLRELISSNIQHDSVLLFFSQVLDGVEAAHLKGVYHRDLKPENILYDPNCNVLVIADFGIARFSEEELFTAVKTSTHRRLANFQYAAPEQRKPGLVVDQRADIYALGLILNEMFTGEVPQGTDFKTIESVNVEFSYLDAIVSMMIKQDQNNRYESIDSIKRDLIAGKNDYISQQKLSELRNVVISVSDLDDPLIEDPPKLVDADWENNRLTLVLSQNVNPSWIWAFQNMGSHTSLFGKGPETFRISGDKAIVSAAPNEVDSIVKYFKGWLPNVNRIYERKIINDKKKEEEEARFKLQHKIKQEELRREIRDTILKNIEL